MYMKMVLMGSDIAFHEQSGKKHPVSVAGEGPMGTVASRPPGSVKVAHVGNVTEPLNYIVGSLQRLPL